MQLLWRETKTLTARKELPYVSLTVSTACEHRVSTLYNIALGLKVFPAWLYLVITPFLFLASAIFQSLLRNLRFILDSFFPEFPHPVCSQGSSIPLLHKFPVQQTFKDEASLEPSMNPQCLSQGAAVDKQVDIAVKGLGRYLADESRAWLLHPQDKSDNYTGHSWSVSINELLVLLLLLSTRNSTTYWEICIGNMHWVSALNELMSIATIKFKYAIIWIYPKSTTCYPFYELILEWSFGLVVNAWDTCTPCQSAWARVPAPLPIPISCSPWKAEGNGSSSLLAATHMGDLDWVPSSRLCPDPALAVTGI